MASASSRYLKAVFDKNCDEAWLKEIAQVWRESDDHGIKVATDAGNEYIVLVAPRRCTTFNDALAPVVDEWVAEHDDFDARALVDAARASIAKHAG